MAEPFTAENVDEVVAEGASIMAAYLCGVEEDMAPIEVSNITARSLGIRADNEQVRRVPPEFGEIVIEEGASHA